MNNREKEIIVSGVKLILNAFEEYFDNFRSITRRSSKHFNSRDWHGANLDSLMRLDLYSRIVKQTVRRLEAIMGPHLRSNGFGAAMKRAYSTKVRDRLDRELSETFFNSVVRRAFSIESVTPEIEFITSDFKVPVIEKRDCPICKIFIPSPHAGSTRNLFARILEAYGEEFDYQDMVRDANLIADTVDSHLAALTGTLHMDRLEIIESIFYRNKAAYIIGRIHLGNSHIPLVIVFFNEGEKIFSDAVLLTEDECSIVFSYTRSYFHVDISVPMEMVNFLKTIMPQKPVSEIYTSLGFHKHGKAELYRELSRNLKITRDRFQTAPGKKGMVMLVFTTPSFEVVFKIIKDTFQYPKNCTRREVEDRYRLVFRHNRAGRLVDAQQFFNLEFRKDLFSGELLEEFEKEARDTVSIKGNMVRIKHLYTERRLRPLDIYLAEENEFKALDAIIDYGRAIKELASSNIFPGDLLLKNFGVTRHGRVVFYDYDELCLMTECNFREIPPARSHNDIMMPEPWFYVDDHDVFPEEFRTFLLPPSKFKEVFEAAYGDIFQADFWKKIQSRIRSGEKIHIYPYKQSRRFGNSKY